MNNLTNYHSHCTFCDGHAPIEDFVKAAIAQGFTSYGISSHAPLPFETRWTMNRCDMPAYLAEIQRLKHKYSAEIELYAGLEIDYLDEQSNPSISYFKELPLDYRIGSVHLLHTPEGELVDIDVHKEKYKEILFSRFHNDLRATVVLYYDKLMRMIEKGGFDIVGHADKMSYNATYCQSDLLEQPWYNHKLHEYFTLIAEHKLMVEVNTKAYKEMNVFFPHSRYFSLLKSLNIPVLVNSDSHYPELINSGREQAFAELQSAGIRSVMELHKGCWQEVPISNSALN
ncbi:MAG: histidinol-phosphatase [Bacteroides sp.]